MSRRHSRHYAARTPKMPSGLVGLMENLSKDVLRNNPTEIYAFCADHMKKLLLIRDGSPPKRFLTLEQKITLAKNKVKERAAQRNNNIKKMQELILNKECNEESKTDNDAESKQENIVTIPQSQLAGYKEHELSILTGETHISKTEMPENEIDSKADLTDEINIDLTGSSLDVKFDEKQVIPVATNEDKDIKYMSPEESVMVQNNDIVPLMENAVANIIIEQDTEKNTYVLEHKTLLKPEESNENDLLESNDESALYDFNNKLLDNVKDEETSNFGQINMAQQDIGLGDSKIVVDTSKNVNEDKEVDYNVQNITNLQQNNIRDSLITTNCNETLLDISMNPIIENVASNLEEPRAAEPDDPFNNVLTNKTNTDEILTSNADIICENYIPEINYSESHNLVNNSSMDLETAAITIQKVFRSFLFRNKTLSVDDATNVDINLLIEDKEEKNNHNESNNNVTKDRRTLGISRMDTVLQTVNEEKSLSLSTDDSSTLSSAATIIQARVRGFLVRNKFNNNKTTSSTSGIDSDGQSLTSSDGDNDKRKNKTVLNIHIVPEGSPFLSRDESILTSIDLSLDGSPPNSTNLHPLGYDKTERRKQLKREDAIQSISPPSNNSGKLSEDVDSVKEIFINNGHLEENEAKIEIATVDSKKALLVPHVFSDENISTIVNSAETEEEHNSESSDGSSNFKHLKNLEEMTSDEMDVITPNAHSDEKLSSSDSVNDIKLMHSGEFHDVVLPTKVSRSDTSVVREFQNVVVYFLLWNHS